MGGNTSCVAVYPNGSPVPTIVLDAGTGLRAVTGLTGGEPFRGTILLSHLHWDHVQGLPFFVAGDRPDSVVRVVMPDNGGTGVETMARAMSPPHFPIRPDELRGRWRFDAIGEGVIEVEGVAVLAREIPHKGGRTFGYRLSTSDASVAYLPDHLPASDGPGAEAAADLACDVDVLIHGGHFTAAERAPAHAYGHATIDQAIALAERCAAGCLYLFHHSPSRTDDLVDEIERSVADVVPPILVAREGEEIDV